MPDILEIGIEGRDFEIMSTAAMGYNYIPRGEGHFTILTPDHLEYEVDLSRPSCTCTDFLYRGDRNGTCKHIDMMRSETQKTASANNRYELNEEQLAAATRIEQLGCSIVMVAPGRFVVRMPGSTGPACGDGSPKEALPVLCKLVESAIFSRRRR